MRYFLVALALIQAGCFSGGWCREGKCEAPPTDCEGACVPFVGGGWSPVLVRESPDHCPDVAPVAAMRGTTLTACGVQVVDGACEVGEQCLPDEPEWTACVLRDGEHACPDPYPRLTPSGDATVTLCCPR